MCQKLLSDCSCGKLLASNAGEVRTKGLWECLENALPRGESTETQSGSAPCVPWCSKLQPIRPSQLVSMCAGGAGCGKRRRAVAGGAALISV